MPSWAETEKDEGRGIPWILSRRVAAIEENLAIEGAWESLYERKRRAVIEE